MVDEFPDDPSAPVFFLSYARTHRPADPVGSARRQDERVQQFFADLSENVNQLISFTPGQDPGFMDRTMDGGERWRDQLLRSAGTCQIFVCLLSEQYLRSEWCAMEWDIFTRRQVLSRSTGMPDVETNIIPVLWAPIRSPMPPPLREVQRFFPADLPDAAAAARYHTDGLFGLLQMSFDSVYEAFTWKLAMLIQRLHFSHWVEPGVPTTTDDLTRSFTR